MGRFIDCQSSHQSLAAMTQPVLSPKPDPSLGVRSSPPPRRPSLTSTIMQNTANCNRPNHRPKYNLDPCQGAPCRQSWIELQTRWPAQECRRHLTVRRVVCLGLQTGVIRAVPKHTYTGSGIGERACSCNASHDPYETSAVPASWRHHWDSPFGKVKA